MGHSCFWSLFPTNSRLLNTRISTTWITLTKLSLPPPPTIQVLRQWFQARGLAALGIAITITSRKDRSTGGDRSSMGHQKHGSSFCSFSPNQLHFARSCREIIRETHTLSINLCAARPSQDVGTISVSGMVFLQFNEIHELEASEIHKLEVNKIH